MIDTTQLLADVLAAVNEVGATVTVTTFADTYSTATGKTTRTATTHSVLASPLYSSSKQLANDNRTPAQAQMLLPASVVTFSLVPGAKVTVSGRVWTVQRVTTHTAGSTVVAYELELSEGAA